MFRWRSISRAGSRRLVSEPSGKRKLKKHRTQARKYEAAGGFRRTEAQSADEVDRLLSAFFEMKAARFRKAGIADVFAQARVKAFFRKLFLDALPLTPKPFVLHGLEVGGKLRAVTGSSRTAGRLICEFSAIADDEIAHASPGEFLFFANIQEACDEGLAVYDFGVRRRTLQAAVVRHRNPPYGRAGASDLQGQIVCRLNAIAHRPQDADQE